METVSASSGPPAAAVTADAASSSATHDLSPLGSSAGCGVFSVVFYNANIRQQHSGVSVTKKAFWESAAPDSLEYVRYELTLPPCSPSGLSQPQPTVRDVKNAMIAGVEMLCEPPLLLAFEYSPSSPGVRGHSKVPFCDSKGIRPLSDFHPCPSRIVMMEEVRTAFVFLPHLQPKPSNNLTKVHKAVNELQDQFEPIKKTSFKKPLSQDALEVCKTGVADYHLLKRFLQDKQFDAFFFDRDITKDEFHRLFESYLEFVEATQSFFLEEVHVGGRTTFSLVVHTFFCLVETHGRWNIMPSSPSSETLVKFPKFSVSVQVFLDKFLKKLTGKPHVASTLLFQVCHVGIDAFMLREEEPVDWSDLLGKPRNYCIVGSVPRDRKIFGNPAGSLLVREFCGENASSEAYAKPALDPETVPSPGSGVFQVVKFARGHFKKFAALPTVEVRGCKLPIQSLMLAHSYEGIVKAALENEDVDRYCDTLCFPLLKESVPPASDVTCAATNWTFCSEVFHSLSKAAEIAFSKAWSDEPRLLVREDFPKPAEDIAEEGEGEVPDVASPKNSSMNALHFLLQYRQCMTNGSPTRRGALSDRGRGPLLRK